MTLRRLIVIGIIGAGTGLAVRRGYRELMKSQIREELAGLADRADYPVVHASKPQNVQFVVALAMQETGEIRQSAPNMLRGRMGLTFVSQFHRLYAAAVSDLPPGEPLSSRKCVRRPENEQDK